MTTAFEALEARTVTAVFAHLANRTATLNDVSVTGIFDAPGTLGNVGEFGITGTQPIFTLATTSVTTDPVGHALVIGATTYTVVAHEPDGTGISRLILERS